MKCRKCGRELKDPESIAIGIGPVCRERDHKMRARHTGYRAAVPGQMTLFDIWEEDDGGREGTGDADEGGAGEPGD